ncbi:MAG: hypothetical protein QXI39_08770 [Candidatus Bathyarchaeia archaeon]
MGYRYRTIGRVAVYYEDSLKAFSLKLLYDGPYGFLLVKRRKDDRNFFLGYGQGRLPNLYRIEYRELS